MKINTTSPNNINYKGFKADYKALQRQQYKAKFLHANCPSQPNLEFVRNADAELQKLFIENPIKTFIFSFIDMLKQKSFSKVNSKFPKIPFEIRQMEALLIKQRENMTVDINGKKIKPSDFPESYIMEKDLSQRMKMHSALVAAQEPLKESLSNLISARNNFAQKRGYKNYYELVLKERYKLDANEIDKLIEEFSGREDIKANLIKRKEILANHFGINLNELEASHFIPLTDLIDVNSYIKTPQELVQITKEAYQSMGFDIKKIEQEGRIFYDLYPQEGKSRFRSFCRMFPMINSVGICTSITPNVDSAKVLMHEFGHMVYNFGLSNLLPMKNKVAKPVFTEAIAMTFEKIVEREDLLKDIIPKEVYQTFKEYSSIEQDVINTLTIIETQLEKELYENPKLDIRKRKNELNEKYGLNSNAAMWYVDHYVTNPVRRPVYLKASNLSEKIYDKLSKISGGKILNNPQIINILTKNIFKYGDLLSDEAFDRKLNNLV